MSIRIVNELRGIHFFSRGLYTLCEFDIICKNTGEEPLEFGNSSFCFAFYPGTIEMVKAEYNPSISTGNYLMPTLKVIGQRFLLIQCFENGGGMVFATGKEYNIARVKAEVRLIPDFFLKWDRLNSAVVDRNLLTNVMNSFTGDYEHDRDGAKVIASQIALASDQRR